jgi:hypothetical protein
VADKKETDVWKVLCSNFVWRTLRVFGGMNSRGMNSRM